jgi:LAO/AO transport system kinase
MAITSRKAQLAKSEFNRALHLFPAKKVRLDSYNCNLQCNYTRRIPEVWETITKFIELTKSNDYFNENAGTERILMLEAINEQLKGNFITIPKYKTCWNQLKCGAKR